MLYEWDEAKNQSNFRKHGVRFEEAQTVFDDPELYLSEDEGSFGEQRFLAIGVAHTSRKLFVVFCERRRRGEEVTRLISARELSRREQKHLAQLRYRGLAGVEP